MIDVGPNLAAILGSIVTALVPVIVLWIKGSRDHAETTGKVDDLHAKLDALAPKDSGAPSA